MRIRKMPLGNANMIGERVEQLRNINNMKQKDLLYHLNSKGIAVRSGQHCAKLLDDFLNSPATVRASIYFYNDEEDIDAFGWDDFLCDLGG